MQWASEMQHDVLDWPDETEPLRPMTLKLFKAAIFSFAKSKSLGWDGVHTRDLLELPDEILHWWIPLLLKCERSGIRSVQVGIVVVVLLPKPDGGFRPIGLPPHLPRVWVRVRRGVAKSWEAKCDRPFLYAGAGRGPL